MKIDKPAHKKLKFQIDITLLPNERIAVQGNLPCLGSWDIKNCKLASKVGNIWVAEVNIDIMLEFFLEYKYIKLVDGKSEGEPGTNRILKLNVLQECTITDVWGGGILSIENTDLDKIIRNNEATVAKIAHWKCDDVSSFISEIGFSQYIKEFKEHEVDGPALAELNNTDLSNMGVTKIGHQKAILRAITKLLQSL